MEMGNTLLIITVFWYLNERYKPSSSSRVATEADSEDDPASDSDVELFKKPSAPIGEEQNE